MNKHLEHVLKNSKFCKGSFISELKDFDFKSLIFDTESCSKYRGSNKDAKVYSWGLGCTGSDKMIYGLDLNHFLKSMFIISDYHYHKKGFKTIKKTKKGYPQEHFIKLPMAVHNLAWDVEFIKYFLHDIGYKYLMSDIQANYKPYLHYTAKLQYKPKHYHIVQSDGQVYGCEIILPFRHEKQNKDGSITKVAYVIDMFDTLKIMNTSIDKIGAFTKGMDEMFDKMSKEYDYNRYREPNEKPTDTELRYLYNDIYRLKRAVEDFYINILEEYNLPITKRTASSIAFEVLKKMTFRGARAKYNKAYKDYFEIDNLTNFEPIRKRMENKSYGGGYTHLNHLHVDKTVFGQGGSLDINSSYPDKMNSRLLPYGKPETLLNGIVPDFGDKKVGIIECGFDFVKPKKPEFNLPVFKIGSLNSKSLRKIYGDLSGNEYFATNIKNGEVINVYHCLYDEEEETSLESNYQMCITSKEYEFFVNHFDFGRYDDNGKMKWNGLEVGNVLVYKAEIGKVSKFVQHFTKMKVLYKGRDKEQILEDLKKNQNYYDGILNEEELANARNIGVQKDPVLVAFAKLCLNSSYGKFGTKTHKMESDIYFDHNGLCKTTTAKDEASIEYDTMEFYRPFASFVTSYGRLHLWNAIIYAVGVENFLYCDTDSIYFRRNVEEVINNMNSIGEYIDKATLGCWDLETRFDAFKGLGQKKYMVHLIEGKYKVKCCGLPKNAQDVIANQGFNEFYLGKEVEGKKQKTKVVGGALLKNVKYKIQKVMFS